jgi:osmoprotectant transport system permease protein
MIEYFARYHDRLLTAFWEHLEITVIALALSLALAAVLTVACTYSPRLSRVMLNGLAMVYSIPSLALLALLIPVTGLGKTTAVTVLVIYNQYLLLRNFLAGLDGVDSAVTEAAAGLGMTHMQILLRVKLPLARKALIAGVRIALVSTVGIATIAASINAGGLGTILFDGLRTLNYAKIVWGSLLSAVLAIAIDRALIYAEKRSDREVNA